MELERFNNVVKDRVAECLALLVPKGEEYSRGGDRLHNFKVAGRIEGISPERALRGIDLKHRASIMDLVDDIEEGKLPSMKLLAEKMTDSINYLLLLEALIVERVEAGEHPDVILRSGVAVIEGEGKDAYLSYLAKDQAEEAADSDRA